MPHIVLSVAVAEGGFALKVVFYKNPVSDVWLRTDPRDILFESPTVAFKVKELPERDTMSHLLPANLMEKLPGAIAHAHYLGRARESLRFPRADIERILPRAVESVFHETLLYGMILGTASPTDLQKPGGANKGQAFADEFLRRYPESWLLPEVYLRLFDCYVQQRKYREALQVAESALKLPDIHPLYDNMGFSNRVERVRQRMTK
ncbi:MAG: hypothetical protein MZU97_18630 [Bacillus subtilis]|nr:hypothetical protein [Bacillus subtilis]